MKTVLGHSCEWLQAHYKAANYGCIPRIDEDGTIGGCDDYNSLVIQFCPGCGTKLETNPPQSGSNV